MLQVVLNVLDFGMDVQEAVDAPRFHHQWLPDEIRVEEQGFPLDVRARARRAWATRSSTRADMGDVHAIWIDPATGVRYGASDPRLDGRTHLATERDMDTLTLPLDYQAISRILPHRYPFLLVDRITEFEVDTRIVGIKNVTPERAAAGTGPAARRCRRRS